MRIKNYFLVSFRILRSRFYDFVFGNGRGLCFIIDSLCCVKRVLENKCVLLVWMFCDRGDSKEGWL